MNVHENPFFLIFNSKLMKNAESSVRKSEVKPIFHKVLNVFCTTQVGEVTKGKQKRGGERERGEACCLLYPRAKKLTPKRLKKKEQNNRITDYCVVEKKDETVEGWRTFSATCFNYMDTSLLSLPPICPVSLLPFS